MLTLKKSSSFIASLTMTQQEWDTLFPDGDEIVVSQVGSGSVKFPLAVAKHPALLSLVFTADTSGWVLGDYEFDVKITRDGVVSFIPELSNFKFKIIEGVTE